MSRRVKRIAGASGSQEQSDGTGVSADAGAEIVRHRASQVANQASGEGWELRRGDCLALMADMPADSVDVVITDPPYDKHTHESGRRGHMGAADFENRGSPSKRATFNRNRDLGFKALTQHDMATAAGHFARVARRWSLVFCTVEMVGDSAADRGHGWRAAGERSGLEYVRTCVWHKLGATPQFTGDRPAQAVEAIVCFHRPGRKRWNGGGKHGYYAHPIVLNRGGDSERLHTTQKPLSLMRELVSDFTEPGELVLDAYAGSGTTLLAAKQLGRRSTGFELAACAKCLSLAEWRCLWRDGKELQSAYLCDSHHAEVAALPGFVRAARENYFDIACRRLRGDEARPRPGQPSLFDAMRVGE